MLSGTRTCAEAHEARVGAVQGRNPGPEGNERRLVGGPLRHRKARNKEECAYSGEERTGHAEKRLLAWALSGRPRELHSGACAVARVITVTAVHARGRTGPSLPLVSVLCLPRKRAGHRSGSGPACAPLQHCLRARLRRQREDSGKDGSAKEKPGSERARQNREGLMRTAGCARPSKTVLGRRAA